MRGKGRYKFKVINGVLSWKNEEMEKFMPISAEILTRVIMLYENEFKHGIQMWNKIKEKDSSENPTDINDPMMLELARWMEQLQAIFTDTEPLREKVRWIDDQIHLN
ncbi:MAG TPA: hypothetical protein VGG71_12325 [Chitinophagaceae bacterium]|jgi:hypothetical protein